MGTQNKYYGWRWDEGKTLYSRILNTFKMFLVCRTRRSITLLLEKQFQGVHSILEIFDLLKEIMEGI